MEKDDLKVIVNYLSQIIDKLDSIDSKLSNIKLKNAENSEKLKYSMISKWKEHIQNDCKYKEKVNIEEEAEFFCEKMGDICNLINCPLNKRKK
jgi:hypothetical protein